MITAFNSDFIQILDLLDDGDICPLSFAVLLLIVFGRALTSEPQQKWCAGLAAVASLIYAASLLVRLPPHDGDSFLGLTVRVLLAFGLAWGVAMFVLAAFSFLSVHAFESAWSKVQLHRRLASQRRTERHARRRAEQSAAQDFPDTSAAEQPDEHWQQQMESEREAKKAKEDARARCELLYALHAPELEKRFSKETFDDFVNRYLNDDHSADYVESRAQQLEETIRQHLEKVQPSRKMGSLEEIMNALQKEKQRIKNMSVDDDTKEDLFIELEERFDELTKRFIREMQP